MTVTAIHVEIEECPHIGFGAPKSCCTICLGKPVPPPETRVIEEAFVKRPTQCAFCGDKLEVGQMAARVHWGHTTRWACLGCEDELTS